MDTLDQKRIEKGKKLLLISLGILTVLRLALAVLLQLIVEETVSFDQFDEVYWLMIPVILLMGAAVYRGGKPVRYIMSGLLVVAVVLEVYLFVLAGFPDSTFMVTSILAWLTTGFVLYVIMIDNATEEFFLVQRSKNFGEYAVVRNAETSNSQSTAKPKKKKEKPVENTAEEVEDDLADFLGEDEAPEEPTPDKKKKKRRKSDWSDELDLFE